MIRLILNENICIFRIYLKCHLNRFFFLHTNRVCILHGIQIRMRNLDFDLLIFSIFRNWDFYIRQIRIRLIANDCIIAAIIPVFILFIQETSGKVYRFRSFCNIYLIFINFPVKRLCRSICIYKCKISGSV